MSRQRQLEVTVPKRRRSDHILDRDIALGYPHTDRTRIRKREIRPRPTSSSTGNLTSMPQHGVVEEIAHETVASTATVEVKVVRRLAEDYFGPGFEF